ncbi:MAG: class II aldolase/adducin family protein [Oxalobacter formigenes]|nr:class II aldolase/adducin family protein [Oxalobacter formigenes]
MADPTTPASESTLRETLLQTARKLVSLGLNKGSAGNASVRLDTDTFLITPSGLPPEDMTTGTLVALSFSGNSTSPCRPSTEWRLHRDLLARRPDANAVIHVHSPFAVTLACLHKTIPPFHYMIAAAGGDSVRCAPYALFGTQALSDRALEAIRERNACLLAHHGMVAIGRDLKHALSVAVETESLCEQYWRILQLGEPILLSETQMQEVQEQFRHYGQWRGHAP